MAKAIRQIVKIDEDLCNGCGLCVPACAEGAIQIIDGKARVVSEKYCDGLGACLGECPQGAISIETREAEEFDEEAVVRHLSATGRSVHDHAGHSHAPHPGHAGHGAHKHAGFVCPSARTIDRTSADRPEASSPSARSVPSELRQWPVKLYLVNPESSFFENAELLVSADCVPFAYGGLHPDFLKGKVLVTGCPKFDDTELYLEKLTEIFRRNNIRSVTVLRMEVPCCSGISLITRQAIADSGKNIPMQAITVTLAGDVQSRAAVPV